MSLIHNHYNQNNSVKPKLDEIHITQTTAYFLKVIKINYHIVILANYKILYYLKTVKCN